MPENHPPPKILPNPTIPKIRLSSQSPGTTCGQLTMSNLLLLIITPQTVMGFLLKNTNLLSINSLAMFPNSLPMPIAYIQVHLSSPLFRLKKLITFHLSTMPLLLQQALLSPIALTTQIKWDIVNLQALILTIWSVGLRILLTLCLIIHLMRLHIPLPILHRIRLLTLPLRHLLIMDRPFQKNNLKSPGLKLQPLLQHISINLSRSRRSSSMWLRLSNKEASTKVIS